MSSIRRSAIVSPPAGAIDAVNAVTSVTRCPCAMSVASVAPAENAASSRCGDTASTWSWPVPGMRGVGARRTTCALQTLVRSRTCGWIREWTNDRPASQHWSTRLRDYRPTPWTSRPSRRCASAGRRAPSWRRRPRRSSSARRPIRPTLLLAGGSNVVVADAGVDATVVRVLTRGVAVDDRGDHVVLRAAAGEPWDDLVARCVADGLVGVECLAGIPGSTGATPIQNVGAYGQEVADTLVAVRVLDRATGAVAELAPADCGFGYRTSAFKRTPGPLGGPRRRAAPRAGQRERADPLRGARPHARRRDRRPRAARRGARGRPRAAPRQGHGARPRRPRHLVGRLVLHEPVRRRRRSFPTARPRSRSPTGR